MECALEGDEAKTLRRASGGVILARHLDGALERLGAGVGEEHGIGKRRLDQPAGQPLAFGNAIEVRGVPQLLPLAHQCGHQVGMGMAEDRHGDAGAEIEVFDALGGVQARTLAPFEREIEPGIGGEQWSHDRVPFRKTKNAAGCGGIGPAIL
jgi:hypothetical protein